MSPISQKAHDIAFAVFRCAEVMDNVQLRKELESAAIDFLSGFQNQIENIIYTSPVDKLERLISFSESINELKTVNAAVLRRELGNLQTAIAVHNQLITGKEEVSTGKESLDISNMFTASALPDAAAPKKKTQPSLQSETVNDEAPDASITDRQSIILRFIREIPFCRLRNILENMPDVSERTIRNDIQSLIEKQLVKRIGGGGPNSYFESMEIMISQRSTLSA